MLLKEVTPVGFARRNARVFVALGLTALLYFAAQLPELSAGERASLAARFAFVEEPLDAFPDRAGRTVREVHPSLDHIAGWISTVGAAVALNDIDGDGLPNDACYVDTRSDLVVVTGVPGTPARYAPFVLDPAPLTYDPATMAPMGCVPGDYDENGLLDVLVYYWGRTPILFLRTGGAAAAGAFVPRELRPGGEPERWYTNAATVADLDGDGHQDLLICNYFQDGARILDAAAGGVERMHASMTRASNGGRNRFFLWKDAQPGSAVRFEEADAGLPPELTDQWTLAVGAADLDGDHRPEVFVANDFGPDRLLWNRSTPGALAFEVMEGVRGLTTPHSKVLNQDTFKGMGLDFGDLNGDGLLDIHVCNIATEFGLEESHLVFVSTGDTERFAEGTAPYVERSEALGLSRDGWAWEARFGDFDNDGVLEVLHATGFLAGEANRWPELHEVAMGNDQLLQLTGSWHRFEPGDDLSGHQHNPFYVRAADGRYYDLAPDVGLGATHVTRGIATADVDGDGDLDLAVANQWQAHAFYTNQSADRAPAGGAGEFLGLHLRLPAWADDLPGVYSGHPQVGRRGRPATGAEARVRLADGSVLAAQVDGGTGHSGVRSPDLHFGLGRAPAGPLAVELTWRDGEGRVQEAHLELEPGWHTVLLGAGLEEGL